MWAVIGAGEMLTQRRRGAKKTTIECSCTPSAPLRLSVIFSDHQTGSLVANLSLRQIVCRCSLARPEGRTCWFGRYGHGARGAGKPPELRPIAPHAIAI